MNNFEKIKQMTVDEMAEFLDEKFLLSCGVCRYNDKGLEFCVNNNCDCYKGKFEGLKQYLLQEVEEWV